MTERFLLSPAARADLSDIWSFSIDHWGQDQAEAYLRVILVACNGLAQNPQMGIACDAIRPGYRRLTVKSHRLYYRVADDDIVNIIRILHMRMEPRTQM